MRQRRRGVLRDQRGGESYETEVEESTQRPMERGILRDRSGGSTPKPKGRGIR